MKIDFCYVINLNSEDCVDRIKQVPFHTLTKYYVMDAINGWDIVNKPSKSPFKYKAADWWKIDSNVDFWNREVTPGEIGCSLSHYKVIKTAYAEGFSGILILEEDFVSQGAFPTEEMLDSIPKDASIVYLDRNKVNPKFKEERINKHLTRASYSYNTHAYLVTRKGMKEIISNNFLDNIIPLDEYYSAVNGVSDRADAIAKLHIKGFKSYAFRGGFFNQSSNTRSNSLTEFPPEVLNAAKQPNTPSDIQNVNDFEAWSKKYIHPMVRSQEFELLTDEPAPNIYNFPFFTKAFCSELIELSEKHKWTTDRHEFYPTTDNLLKVLGMDKIYNKVINTYVRPLVIWAYGLEGKSWEHLKDESFIIKYPHDQQSHLSLHHDFSNVTTLVNLNPGEFKGGGTYFPKYKLNVNPDEIGTMTLHPGNITHKHGARPVTEGTRYVVVSFIKGASHI